MPAPSSFRLGDLQLRIMKILWERRLASVADVHAALAASGDLAYTTIATMLRKMERRGLVSHRRLSSAELAVIRAVGRASG